MLIVAEWGDFYIGVMMSNSWQVSPNFRPADVNSQPGDKFRSYDVEFLASVAELPARRREFPARG